MATTSRTLDAADARTVVAAVLRAVEAADDRPTAVAVVDRGGALLCCARQPGAAARLLSRARAKAFTAAMAGQDTVDFRNAMRREPGRTLADWGEPWLTSLQGGVVVRVEGTVAGGIGCAGNPTPRDEALARFGARAIEL